MPKRMQYCFNCGAELGVYRTYSGDPPEVCGAAECQREACWSAQAERAERQWEAEQDDYSRY